MLKSNSNKPSIDLATCAEHVASTVFRLQPSSYGKEYPDWPGLVGLEIEMQPFLKSSLEQGRPALASLHAKDGLAEILGALAYKEGWNPNFFQDAGGDHLLGIKLEQQDNLSFEPGGQLEFSSIPYPCLADALERMHFIQTKLDTALAASGVRLLQSGINPWQSTDAIGLQMQKPRYLAMDRYFQRIGPAGRRMMRQTCTVQVNLDFGDDETILAKRYLLANLVAPFVTAMFAYSPFTDGELTNFKSLRAEAWRKIDPMRTGVPHLREVAKSLDKASCIQAYLEHVLTAPVIFVEALDYEVPPQSLTFARWLAEGYKNVRPTMGDFETHLSLHFPEVRPRGFLELRSVDCQSRVWQSVPAIFYVTLLYVNECMEKALEKLGRHLDSIPKLLEVAGARGLEDPTLAEGAGMLMELVAGHLRSLPQCFQGEQNGEHFLRFAEHFTMRRRSPADDLIDAAKQSATGKLLPDTFTHIEDQWRKLLK